MPSHDRYCARLIYQDGHISGAHTNNIENCCRWAKAYVRAYGQATSDAELHYHLTAYTWRKSRGESHPVSVFAQPFQDIALVYVV